VTTRATPLLVGPPEIEALERLREQAAAHPVDMPQLVIRMKTKDGKREHKRQMTRQSVPIPFAFMVTFSIETGHPAGVCRHMSMSTLREGALPVPEGVWMVAQHLGFTGSIQQCHAWIEDLSDGGQAVNIVQPLAHREEGGRA
jgi:hypothetical protein